MRLITARESLRENHCAVTARSLREGVGAPQISLRENHCASSLRPYSSGARCALKPFTARVSLREAAHHVCTHDRAESTGRVASLRYSPLCALPLRPPPPVCSQMYRRGARELGPAATPAAANERTRRGTRRAPSGRRGVPHKDGQSLRRYQWERTRKLSNYSMLTALQHLWSTPGQQWHSQLWQPSSM
jgi:hypothetical protein